MSKNTKRMMVNARRHQRVSQCAEQYAEVDGMAYEAIAPAGHAPPFGQRARKWGQRTAQVQRAPCEDRKPDCEARRAEDAYRSRARPRRPDRRREDEQHQQHRKNHDTEFAAPPHHCELMQHVKAAPTFLPPPSLSMSAFVRNDMRLSLRAFGHLPAISF